MRAFVMCASILGIVIWQFDLLRRGWGPQECLALAMPGPTKAPGWLCQGVVGITPTSYLRDLGLK
ncbi:hypothetical protein DX116_18380 [Aeromicrobium endophyticum]|uniref:Uncharacterized protein n=1 Tax=Aeromicrobium endophyticum TaxID=2292704 RepID=A0A371NYR8_9ACTN|nr:hypothetical protein DX116_18380 [Aeromicrobium endophyticum]